MLPSRILFYTNIQNIPLPHAISPVFYHHPMPRVPPFHLLQTAWRDARQHGKAAVRTQWCKINLPKKHTSGYDKPENRNQPTHRWGIEKYRSMTQKTLSGQQNTRSRTVIDTSLPGNKVCQTQPQGHTRPTGKALSHHRKGFITLPKSLFRHTEKPLWQSEKAHSALRKT